MEQYISESNSQGHDANQLYVAAVICKPGKHQYIVKYPTTKKVANHAKTHLSKKKTNPLNQKATCGGHTHSHDHPVSKGGSLKSLSQFGKVEENSNKEYQESDDSFKIEESEAFDTSSCDSHNPDAIKNLN